MQSFPLVFAMFGANVPPVFFFGTLIPAFLFLRFCRRFTGLEGR